MKKVFTNSELAHAYAAQSQNEGRNPNGSFYFHGKTLFSYGSHFPICKFTTNEAGERVLLFTERTYSNTTAKQISLARNATSHFEKIYCANPNETHEHNFNAWRVDAELTARKLERAKKPILYLNELQSIGERANIYASFFGVSIPEPLALVLGIKDKNEYTEYAKQKNELAKKLEKARQLKAKKEFKESFKKWQNLEIPYLYARGSYDFLRLNAERVDTTQGVQIPAELAKRIYNSIKSNTLSVGDKVLNFTVNAIGKEIKIGCHTFKRSYLLDFGAKLG